jgi:hypothetical protein
MNEEEQPQPMIDKLSNWYKGLPDKKRYAEFISAFLSIPVLVTVIISNVNNLNKTKEPVQQPTPTQIVQYVPVGNVGGANTKQTPEKAPVTTPSVSVGPTNGECKKEVGPVDISYPSEGTTITENPVPVVVSYHTGEYCAVVWSYRINGGVWSQFDDKSFALFNLPEGDKRLELRVKSIASGQEVFVVRNFYYQTSDSPTPEATESAVIVRG